MMKNVTILLLFLITAPVAYAQTASAEWVQTIANGTKATNAVVDKAGNIYSAGRGNTSFTVGGITSPGFGMYLCKNNTAGTPIWVVRSISTSGFSVKQIATDNHCNIYVRGQFTDSIGFGNLPQINIDDVSADYLVKYDSAGNALWDTWISSGGGIYDMIIDSSDNLLVAGNYNYGAYFGSLTDTLAVNDTTKSYIVKYDGSTGNTIWKKSINAAGISALAVDNADFIYSIGGFSSAFDLDGIILNPISIGGNCAYISKMDSGGHTLWAQGFNIGTPVNGGPLRVTTNGHGGCFLAGNIGNGAVFGTINLSSANGDLFMARYADDGTLQWAENLSNNYLHLTGIGADTTGNIFLSMTKNYTGTGTSIFGSASIPAPTTNGNLVLITGETDTTGVPVWAIYAMHNNGNNSTLPPSTMDKSGNIYMAGTCNTGGGSVVFSNQTATLPTYGNFLAKLSPPPAAVPLTVKKPVASVFPNPASSMATVRFSSAAYDRITVTDAVGKTVYVHTIGKGQQEVGLNVSGYAAGAYFIELSGRGGVAGAKLVVGK